LRIDAKRYNAVAVDLAGTVLGTREGDVPAREKAILDLIRRLHAQFTKRFSASRCLGIGLVTPGPFDTTWPGELPPGAIPLLQTRTLATRIGEVTGTDVFQENDAYAAAIGEKLYGAARDLSDFFYLFIGEGVGAGIVIDGESYRGSSGNGGEAGHLIVDPSGPKCYCGNRGCLGQYLSLQTLHKHESERGIARGREIWLKRAAPALSIALASIENLFDPQMVILGGSVPAAMLEALAKRLGALRPSVRQDMSERLRLSTLGERSAALGASALPLLAASTTITRSGPPAAVGKGSNAA
jgi:predicted NBD/HSP70 family sugar kinase